LGLQPSPPPSPAQHLWIKRDDQTAEPYGGNKVRKLEFLLAAATSRGARRLITVGAAGSHHALATTIYGRRLGFDVTLVLFPQPLTPHVRDVLLLDHAHGAELRYTRRMETVPAALFVAALRYRSQRAFIIPAGGSDATGTLGYVSAALELAEQIERGELPAPASVVVAAGTLGTAAGLALGFAIAGLQSSIMAVRITSRIVTNERVLARLIRGAESLLRRGGLNLDVASSAISRVELVHEHIGRGYGQETPAGAQAAKLFEAKGIGLDPTYTGKAAAAFIERVPTAKKPMLFWQTLSGSSLPAAGLALHEHDLPKPFRDYIASAIG
jgi:1-aminocyclopropane-1-carboxylate deaminase/D-cysteine desulfhydrase-like pyridoxal-dependent ACC family enzyme